VNDEILRERRISDMRHARPLLAKIVTAICAAHPRAIALDFFFLSEPEPGTSNTQELITAIRDANCPVIVGVAQAPIEMSSNERDYQQWFVEQTKRKAGFVNVRYETEDKVVRFYPDASSSGVPSFAQLLAESSGTVRSDAAGQRIPWLLPPRNGFTAFLPQKDDDKRAFLTIDAQRLLPPSGTSIADPTTAGSTDLKDKIVIIGADLPRSDKHFTPFSVWTSQKTPGVFIHAHMTAGLIDVPPREITEVSRTRTIYISLAVALVGVLVGWFFSQSLLLGFVSWTLGLIALIIVDAIIFYSFHQTLPMMQTVAVWFLAVTAGHSIRSGWFGSDREAEASI